MLNVFRCGHLGRTLEVLGVLPEVFESAGEEKSIRRTVIVEKGFAGLSVLIGCFHFWTRLR